MPKSQQPEIRLSAALSTKDSMATLPACLDSLDFCDEIVVVDDHSTDGTWEHLQARGGKVRPFQRRLDSLARHRRALVEQTRGQWLLIVDADEAALPGLGDEIIALLDSEPRQDAFHVPQKNLLPAHWPRSVHFWTSQKRLLRKGAISWSDSQWVHTPAVHRGRAGRLRHGLLHHSFDSVMHLTRKQLAYGRSGAQHFHRRGRKAGFWTTVGHTLGAFLKYYLGKGLVWRGMGGFVVAFSHAFYAFTKYALLWELSHGRAESERSAVPGDRDEDASATRAPG